MSRINVELPPVTHRLAKAAAALAGLTLADWIVIALDRQSSTELKKGSDK